MTDQPGLNADGDPVYLFKTRDADGKDMFVTVLAHWKKKSGVAGSEEDAATFEQMQQLFDTATRRYQVQIVEIDVENLPEGVAPAVSTHGPYVRVTKRDV